MIQIGADPRRDEGLQQVQRLNVQLRAGKPASRRSSRLAGDIVGDDELRIRPMPSPSSASRRRAAGRCSRDAAGQGTLTGLPSTSLKVVRRMRHVALSSRILTCSRSSSGGGAAHASR